MKPLAQLTDDEFGRVLRSAVSLQDAPDALVRSAIDLWPGATASPIRAVAEQLLRSVRAVLSFDSWAPQSMALGMRSVPSGTRHLLFSAEGRDIDVRIVPSHAGFSVAGQILGPDEAGSVELRPADGAGSPATGQGATTLDALGEFRLDGVARGTYLMTLRLSGEVIELPPIEVGERPG